MVMKVSRSGYIHLHGNYIVVGAVLITRAFSMRKVKEKEIPRACSITIKG